MMSLYYNECINIYTDASCKKLRTDLGEIESTCAGFMATYQGRPMASDMEIYIDEYAIFGEAKAIHLASTWITHFQSRLRAADNPIAINIFSDSLVVVNKINEYLINWFNLLADNKPVRPQYRGEGGQTSWEYYAYLSACSIFSLGLPIRIFYTPGHIGIWKTPFKGIESVKEKMSELNRTSHGDITNELEAFIIHECATFNNMVDIMTRNYLYRNKFAMENSINACKGSLLLGPNKPYSIRWPFVIQPVTSTQTIGNVGMYMLNMPS